MLLHSISDGNHETTCFALRIHNSMFFFFNVLSLQAHLNSNIWSTWFIFLQNVGNRFSPGWDLAQNISACSNLFFLIWSFSKPSKNWVYNWSDSTTLIVALLAHLHDQKHTLLQFLRIKLIPAMLGSGLCAPCSFLNLLCFHLSLKIIVRGTEDGPGTSAVVINECDSTGGSDIVQISLRW